MNGKIGKQVKIQKKLDYKEALKRIRILTNTTMLDVKKIGKDFINYAKFGKDRRCGNLVENFKGR